jgi:succinoglycan biosynthesis transport protein ExoP
MAKGRSFDEEESKPLAPVADILRRRGKTAVICFLLVLAPLISLIRFLPDIYQSGATVLIERQQIPDELVRSTVTSGLEVRLQTMQQEILSRKRLEGLINQFGLYADLKKSAPMEGVIDQMRKDVGIQLRSDAQRGGDRATIAFTVSYKGTDPQKVALVANRLAADYIEENLKMRESQATGTADFLRNQLNELGQKLQDQEKLVSAFKERHIGELPEQMDANLKNLEQLTAQLRLNGDNMARASERKSAVERQLAEALGAAAPSGPETSAARLAQLRGALASVQTRYSDKHPDVMRLKAEIQALEASAGASGPDGRSPAVPTSPAIQQAKQAMLEADMQINGLEVEAASLRRSIAMYQSRVEAAPRRQQEYAAMSREYETTKEMYRSLTVRQRESALSESMEMRQKGEQFRVIEPALPSETPAAPQRPKLFLLVVVLALGVAAAAIVVPEVLDSSLHTMEQAQALSKLPVLITIPRIVGPGEQKRSRQVLLLQTLATTGGVCFLVVASYFVARENWALTSLLLR